MGGGHARALMRTNVSFQMYGFKSFCGSAIARTRSHQTKPRSLALVRHSATHELSKRKGSITRAAT